MLAGSGNQQVQCVRPKGFDNSVLALLAPDNFFVSSSKQECCEINIYERKEGADQIDGKPVNDSKDKKVVSQALQNVQANVRRFYDSAVKALEGSSKNFTAQKNTVSDSERTETYQIATPDLGSFRFSIEYFGTNYAPSRISIQQESCGLLFSITDPEQLGFKSKILKKK